MRYLAKAQSLLFLIDPLSIEAVSRRVRQSGVSVGVNVAAGTYETAYSSSIDQLRATGWDTTTKNIGVVLTKGDALTQADSFEHLATAGPWVIRTWLVENGLDLLIARIDADFDEVRFFMTDAKGSVDFADPLHPLNSVRWMAEKADAEWPLERPVMM